MTKVLAILSHGGVTAGFGTYSAFTVGAGPTSISTTEITSRDFLRSEINETLRNSLAKVAWLTKFCISNSAVGF